MENNQIEQTNDSGGFRILSDEEVGSMQQTDSRSNFNPQLEPQIDSQVEPQFEPQQSGGYAEENYTTDYNFTDEEIDSTVLSYLSEKLGRDFSSFDDLTPQQQMQMDDSVMAIAQFVSETGRGPEDWFAYQSLNPAEMDDLTAIKVSLAGQYPDFSDEDLNLLVQSKYKIDESMYSEDEIRMSKLQMRIDSAEARENIEEIRERYRAPERSAEMYESPFDDSWYQSMNEELDALDGIEFELGEGKSFTFGLDQGYKRQLSDKNARIEEYFDSYVSDDGSWDFDKFNMHRAVVDNIDRIIKSVYQQGMSDGRRNIVNVASNSSAGGPVSTGGQSGPSKLSQQLREALGGNQGMIFNV